MGLQHTMINPGYTMVYQRVLPGMQAEAAATFEQLIQETRRSQVRQKPWLRR